MLSRGGALSWPDNGREALLKLVNSGVTSEAAEQWRYFLPAHQRLVYAFILSFTYFALWHSAAVLCFISFRPRRKGVDRDLVIVLGLSSVLYTQSLSSRINTAVHNLPSADF
jgi:hypothetical protein